MAFQQSNGTTVPHATNYKDLFTKLRTFVETALPVAERYTVMRFVDNGTTFEVIWKTPGLASRSIALTSITRSGTTATVTTSVAHVLTTGDTVIITGATDTLYNGTFLVTVVTSTTFTYVMTGTPAVSPAAGTITLVVPAEEIFFGIQTYFDVTSDYYNWSINTFTGYVASNTFNTQPGRNSSNLGIPLWNQEIPYIFVANGQRLIVSMNVQSNYESLYLGKIIPYATPSQWPYPVVVGGMLDTDSATRFSTAQTSWFKGNNGHFKLRFVDGTYVTPLIMPFDVTSIIWRNTKTISTNNEVVEPGYYGLHSLIAYNITPNVYGELDGIYFISGFSNAVENTLIIDSITYFVLRDVQAVGFKDYVALKLA